MRLFLFLCLSLLTFLPPPSYAARLKIMSFTVAGGASATASRKISISIVSSARATKYRVSENKQFKRAIWKRFRPVFTYSLSKKYGKKTIYIQLRGKAGLSKVHRVVIRYVKGSPASVTSFSIDGGSLVTTSRSVTLSFEWQGSPLRYGVQESSTLANAAWFNVPKGATGMDIPFTLSSNEGKKTVGLRLRDEFGLSGIKTASIELDLAPSIISFTLAAGVPTTSSRTITAIITASGGPAEYQLSEKPDFSGAEWKAYSPEVSYTLSPGSGQKTVYARLRDARSTSEASSASIDLKVEETVILNQTIEPSTESQTITHSSGISITIPPGLIESPTVLRVAKIENEPPSRTKAFATMSAYDISLGDLHDLPQPLKIEIPYDPNLLPSSMLFPVDQMASAYWDSDAQAWIRNEMVADASRLVAIIEAKHLSMEVLWYYALGWGVSYRPHFRVFFNPNASSPFGHPPSMEAFATLVGNYLEDAYIAYKAAGFKIPKYRIDVTLDVFDPLKSAEYTGDIEVPTSYSNEKELAFDLAHEYFHLIQNLYMNRYSMGARRWFVEATADLAAGRLAGQIAFMGEGIRHDYLENPITHDPEINDRHKYHTAWFLDAITGGGSALKNLWAYVADPSWYNVLQVLSPLSEWLEARGSSISRSYQSFARNYVFNAASPMPPISDSLHTEVASLRDNLGEAQDEVTRTMSVPGEYAAKLWGIWVENGGTLPRMLSFEGSGAIPSKMEIDIFVLADDKRSGTTPAFTLGYRDPKKILNIYPNAAVYLLAVNGGTSALSAGVKVTDLTPALYGVNKSVVAWGDEFAISGKNLGDDKVAGSAKSLYLISPNLLTQTLNGSGASSWTDGAATFKLAKENCFEIGDLITLQVGVARASDVTGFSSKIDGFRLSVVPLLEKTITSSFFYTTAFKTRNTVTRYIGDTSSTTENYWDETISNYSFPSFSGAVWPADITRSFSGSTYSETTGVIPVEGGTVSHTLTAQLDQYGTKITQLTVDQTWNIATTGSNKREAIGSVSCIFSDLPSEVTNSSYDASTETWGINYQVPNRVDGMAGHISNCTYSATWKSDWLEEKGRYETVAVRSNLPLDPGTYSGFYMMVQGNR